MSNIVSNSDCQVSISVLNSDGTAFSLVGAVEIKVAVYQKKEKVLQKFSYAHVPSQVTITSASGGLFNVKLDRKNINNVEEKKLFAEVQINIADASYASGVRVEKVTGIELATIVNSAID